MDGFQEVKSRRTKKTEVALANTPAPGSRYPRYINGYQVYGEGSSITSLIKRKFGRDNFDFEPVREVGDGTEDSPLITWFYQAGTNLRYEEAWCEQTEEILTTVARQLGQTHVILRREAHNQRNTYDAMGSIITHTIRTRNGDIDVNTLEFDDWHLTATFGRDDETLYLQGHVYVVWHGQPNRIGSSISLMEQPQFQRHHAKPGEEGTLVLWLCVCSNELMMNCAIEESRKDGREP